MKLGVNIDHVATLRQARREDEPDLVFAAQEALAGGADGITLHLREDRRHIQDADVFAIRKIAPRLNFEMAATAEMVNIAKKLKPEFCCLVPEKRNELTTEGGLDVLAHTEILRKTIAELKDAGILVSLFVDPNLYQIEASKKINADYIEIHTGNYNLEKLRKSVAFGLSLGLRINAGHGLKYHNVQPVAKIEGIEELNIGHSIVSRAIVVGMRQAVTEMKRLVLFET